MNFYIKKIFYYLRDIVNVIVSVIEMADKLAYKLRPKMRYISAMLASRRGFNDALEGKKPSLLDYYLAGRQKKEAYKDGYNQGLEERKVRALERLNK